MWMGTSGRAAASSLTPAIGMCWSFSPKCSIDRNPGLEVLHLQDPPAVVADRGGEAGQASGRRPGDAAAEAIADDPDLAAFAGDRDGGRRVAQRLLEIELAHQGHRAGARLRVVADVETLLDVVEDRRGDGQIPFRGEAVGHLADMRVDAEDLLDDDDPAQRLARGVRPPGGDRPGALGLEFNPLAHWLLQIWNECVSRDGRPFARRRCRR